MVLKSRFRFTMVAALAVACMLLSSHVSAARRSKSVAKDKVGDKVKTVELFAAMASGALDVKVIPKNSKSATVLIENKSDGPVRVQLPEAFAGVPVLGQIGLGGGGGGGFGGGGLGGGGFGGGGFGGGGLGGGGGQGLGGGFGGGGGGGLGGGGFGGGGLGGGGFGGGGFFNLDPGKVRKFKLPTVCLEHGKPDPRPQMKYKLVPIETFTQKPEVIEVCKMLATGSVSQAVAQAAAWHFTDGLTWDQLVNKIGVKHINGMTEPYFQPQQIQLAMRLASEAVRRAAANPAYHNEKADSMSRQ